MTPEQIVGNIVDHIFDVECKDGTITQVAYTEVVRRIQEKNKSNPKEYLESFIALIYKMLKMGMMIDNQMKKIPLNMHPFKIILKEI